MSRTFKVKTDPTASALIQCVLCEKPISIGDTTIIAECQAGCCSSVHEHCQDDFLKRKYKAKGGSALNSHPKHLTVKQTPCPCRGCKKKLISQEKEEVIEESEPRQEQFTLFPSWTGCPSIGTWFQGPVPVAQLLRRFNIMIMGSQPTIL